MKLRSFCMAKDSHSDKMEGYRREIFFIDYTFERRLISKLYNDFSNCTLRNRQPNFKKGYRSKQSSWKMTYKIAEKHLKKFHHS